MKKSYAVVFTVFLGLVLILSACGKAASSPAVPTAVVFASNVTIDSMEDGTLPFTFQSVTGGWSFGNDNGAGGTSSVDAFGTADETAISGTYSIKVTATVKAELAYPGSGYTALAPTYDKVGYVTASMYFDNPVSFASNTMLEYAHLVSDTNGMSYTVYIYDVNNRYIMCVNNNMPVYSSWASVGLTFASSFEVPAGETYTVSDVISNIKKIEWIFRYRSYGTSNKTLNIFIDRIMLHNIL